MTRGGFAGIWKAPGHDPQPQRPLRRLCPLALLPVQVPLLRFQFPRPSRALRRRRLCRRLQARDRPYGRALARAARAVGLLWRRHALVDVAQGCRHHSRCHRPGMADRPQCRNHARGQPHSVEVDRFRGFRAAGINRVSLGVQSLREGPLAELGRRHTVDEAVAAVRIAQSVFDRSSFDLIYGRPKQTLEDWEDELKEALWTGARPYQPLHAHHRAGHALFRPASRPASSRCPTRIWLPISTS